MEDQVKLISLEAFAKILGYKNKKMAYFKTCLQKTKGQIPEPVKVDSVSQYFLPDQIHKFIKEVIGAEIKDEPFITTQDAAKVLGITVNELKYLKYNEALPFYTLKFGGEKRGTDLYRESEILSAFKASMGWNGGFHIKNQRIEAYEKIFSHLLEIPDIKKIVLSENEYNIMQLLFIANKSRSWIAEHFDISRERVRQVYEQSIQKVCQWLTSSNLTGPIMERASSEEIIDDENNRLREGYSLLLREHTDLLTACNILENFVNTSLPQILSSHSEVLALQQITENKKRESINSIMQICEEHLKFEKANNTLKSSNAAEEISIVLDKINKATRLARNEPNQDLTLSIREKLDKQKEERLDSDVSIMKSSSIGIGAINHLKAAGYTTIRKLTEIDPTILREQRFQQSIIKKITQWLRSNGFDFTYTSTGQPQTTDVTAKEYWESNIALKSS